MEWKVLVVTALCSLVFSVIEYYLIKWLEKSNKPTRIYSMPLRGATQTSEGWDG